MANVAFIGLGTMGIAMAHNIIKAGHKVVGYDTDSSAIETHVSNGGIAAISPADAAKNVEIVITMLPIGKVVKTALFDLSGVTETLSEDSLVIDMSSISPTETDEIRAALTAKNIRMIDAPVGRTSEHARAGTLLILAGGNSSDIIEASPVLECLGESITDCGGPGRGSRMKIINNLMSTVLNVLTAEVLTLAESSGLNRDLTIEVMNGTPAGRGHMTTTYPAKALRDDISPDFMLDLAMKDLGLAITMSEEEGVPLALASKAKSIYSDAHNDGWGEKDWTAIYPMLREKYIS